MSSLRARMDRLTENLPRQEIQESSDQFGNCDRDTMHIHANAISPHDSLSSIRPKAAVDVEAEIVTSWNGDAEDSGPAAVPALVLPATKQSPSARASSKGTSGNDVIAKGILILEQAEFLFSHYMTKHENYIYSALEESATFDHTRTSSSLLLAAICAVASLHVVSPDIPYQRCYDEFVQLSASHAFSSRNNLDDVRALCIGAFWLPNISWILVTTGEFRKHCLASLIANDFLLSCSYCNRDASSSSISRSDCWRQTSLPCMPLILSCLRL